ncbi:MAG TPA: aldose epimerase family protein [Pseudonocardiaceae bacterium]|nr:aldose epimerase family protein [Pseudonocardiaceae bacterium]
MQHDDVRSESTDEKTGTTGTTRRTALRLGAVAAGAAVGAGLLNDATAAASPRYTATTSPDSHGGKPTITKEPFGSVGGQSVDKYTLTNGPVSVQIITYGGIIHQLSAPDRHGHAKNIVLGFATLDDYVTYNSPVAGGGVYFGALVGRYANRIAKGTFTLDGVTYHVPVNNNGNSLHGGTVGFNQKVWSATEQHGSDSVGLQLKYVSANGEMGYPGTLTTYATYTLGSDNRLSLRFTATTDAPTVVNLTNHTYWNLAGEDAVTVYDQRLFLNANHYTPTDSTQIPTGAIDPVKGTPLDFTTPTPIGANITADDVQLLTGQGYDLNWVLNKSAGNPLQLAARADDPDSGRVLSIYTTQPGIQFYSGNFLTGTLVGTSSHAYRQGAGFALETQHFPDSPNHPSFPTTTLNPGQTYDQTTVWQFGTA